MGAVHQALRRHSELARGWMGHPLGMGVSAQPFGEDSHFLSFPPPPQPQSVSGTQRAPCDGGPGRRQGAWGQVLAPTFRFRPRNSPPRAVLRSGGPQPFPNPAGHPGGRRERQAGPAGAGAALGVGLSPKLLEGGRRCPAAGGPHRPVLPDPQTAASRPWGSGKLSWAHEHHPPPGPQIQAPLKSVHLSRL